VDDDIAVGRSVAAVLEAHALDVRVCADLVAADDLLESWEPDLVVVGLSDGRAEDLLERLQRVPPLPPTIVAGEEVTPERAFSLGLRGVRSYLRKPVDLVALEGAVVEALERRVDPTALVRAAVGQVALPDLEAQIRRAMIAEAIRRTAGNRRRAARLLGVSRQFLQHALRRAD
jgi:DNA-binding NtrC family response regulator